MARLSNLAAAVLSVSLILARPAPSVAQDDPHAACAMPPSYVPADLLERAVPLREGIGNSRRKVTTASPEAQAFYDQGLNYLESYVWIEASRSFHQALRLDPKMALAYVGLSRVHSGLDNPDAAKRYLEKAKELASGASPRERRLIEIREKQVAAMDDLENADKVLAYRKAIDDALGEDLADPQLWLLRANAEESNPSGRGQRGTAAGVAFYEAVLRLQPDHASAHHYLVHTYETIGRIDKALEHGEQFARLSPAIPHAAHMWGHDLRRVGRVDEAIAQFVKANSLELAYYKSEKIKPDFDWHHAHNLDLLASCYQHKGQMKLAEKTMRASAKLAVVSSYRAFNLREFPNFLIHRGRYKEALEASRELTRMEYPQARSVGHALAGEALLWLGRVDEAKGELAAAQRELLQAPTVTLGLVPRRSFVEPWVEALRGQLLLREGQTEEARTVLKSVVQRLRATPGPDAWTQALFRLEILARSAREVGDWELAEYVAAQMLEHDEAYGGSHMAWALVLEHKGDVINTVAERETARRYWSQADRDLRELKQLESVGPPAESARSG